VEESGSIVLGARLFCEIIRKMPDETVSITAGENFNTRLESADSSFDLIGTSAADYPALPPLEGTNALTIDGRALRSMITQTIFALDDSETRPVYNGELFEVKDKTVTVVALDGARLAMRREELESEAEEEASFIVPGPALSEVERIAAAEDGMVEIIAGPKHVIFKMPNTLLISRRLEGEFLNYRTTIPQNGKYAIGAARRELMDAVERVSLIINDKAKSPVRCIFGDGNISLNVVSAFGRASDVCSTEGDAEKLEIGFNHKYLLDALRAAPADNLRICLASPTAPCIIMPEDTDDGKFLYMILPVRLSTTTANGA
jgi:DNA polymerase-3 subunit beta